MKKLKWATSKGVFGQVATSSCLVAVSAGVIFGVSASTFKIEYMTLNDAQARLKAATEHEYYSQNIISQWNMYQKKNPGEEGYIKGVDQPKSSTVTKEWWDTVHPGTTQLNKTYNNINPDDFELDASGEISKEVQAARTKYSSLIIDGSTHTAMDRSFNQGLYNGLANFNTNVKHEVTNDNEVQVYKPSQDSTQEFINIYRAVAAKTRILALAGFNHVTPLNALGKQKDNGLYEFADTNIANSGMMLMDGDVSNNQNIASVLFRSDEPAFLTALATGMYFYENLNKYHDQYQDLKVACYGGTAIPTVIIYMGGYQRGIEFFNYYVLKNTIIGKGVVQYIDSGAQTSNENEQEVVAKEMFVNKMLPFSKYKNEVEELHSTEQSKKTTPEFIQKRDSLCTKIYDEFSLKMIKLGDFATHFSGTFNGGDAIGISKQYLNRGASAIIAVAGPQSLDSAQEIMNQGSNCIVIGVDSAMERSDYQKPYKNPNFRDNAVDAQGKQSAQASNIIKFSAVKDMTNVSDSILRLAASGKHWNIDNSRPWTSIAQIPSYEQSAVLPEGNTKELVEAAFTITTNDNDGTYDITGTSQITYPGTRHVYNFPLQMVDESTGKTYKLHKISGFKSNEGSSISGKMHLAYIDTIAFSGTKNTDQEIEFADCAFDYSAWDTEVFQDAVPGIKYIDLSNVSPDKVKCDGITFKNMVGTEQTKDKFSIYENGVIKFDAEDTDANKQVCFNKLFNIDEDRTNWQLKEPDPYRSVCSVGFKTCGNIENGLISISWDGWPLLFKTLCLLSFETGTPFFSNWIDWGSSYCDYFEELGQPLPDEFVALFKGTENHVPQADDFNTYDTNHTLCKNYSHVMSILGLVLKNCNVSFDASMTVCIDKEGKPYLPDHSVPMSILDWLKYNMYFTI